MTKIIINGFHDPSHEPLIVRTVNALGARAVEMVCDVFRPRFSPDIEVRAHYFADLSLRADYGVDENTLLPLDDALVAKMAPVETIFLRMCDRIEMVRHTPYEERKRLYLRHLRYWNHRVTTDDIALFLSSNIPHETYDYVAYEVCRAQGVPTLMFQQTQVEDTALLLDDWQNPIPALGERYRALFAEHARSTADDIALDGRFARELERQRDKAKNPTPFYMAPPSTKGPSLSARAKELASALDRRVLDVDFWKRRVDGALKSHVDTQQETELDATYRKLEIAPDLSRRYLYFPMHYQPELTTCPLAGAYVDQLLIAQLISAHLPADVFLYIKEHPKQTRHSRSPALYEALATTRNVQLVPRETDTYALLDGSIGVVTATGTAGWEAIFRERPVMLFGDYFYLHAPGVSRIRTAKDCADALRDITQGKRRPSLKEVKLFLRALADVSIEAYVDVAYRVVSSIDDKASIDNLWNALSARLPKRQAAA